MEIIKQFLKRYGQLADNYKQTQQIISLVIKEQTGIDLKIQAISIKNNYVYIILRKIKLWS